MPDYVAKSMGQHPDKSGKRIRENEKLNWDFGERGPPQWLVLVEAEVSPAPAAVQPEEPVEQPSESAATAEPRARRRKGAE
jgi:hypothetical protein